VVREWRTNAAAVLISPYDPTVEDEAMHHDIDVLNGEMEAAGVTLVPPNRLPGAATDLCFTRSPTQAAYLRHSRNSPGDSP